MQQIKKGDTGQAVRVLQYLLGVKATGTFDGVLDMTVRLFQGDRKIKIDGIAGPITWGMAASAQRQLQAGPVKNGKATIGSRGNDVRAVQDMLCIKVDGLFGPQTQGAVSGAQEAGGLPVTGVVDAATWAYLLTAYAPVKQPVEYKQGDNRWKKYPYTSCGNKSQTISSSGCGIVCAAMVVATWLDPKITPPDMADLAVKNGYRTKNSGTAWAFFPFLAKKYGLKCMQYSSKYGFDPVIKALRKGALVVCSMGPGYFTTGGHYILAWTEDGKSVVVNNPGAGHSRDKGTYATFKKECRAYFIFTK
jgi:peptidoglycan hydrolase-like protein with peptidoglycan-binding domain